jgi:hypothetical protein
MESYLDIDANNKWKKVSEVVDSGKWFADTSDEEFYSVDCVHLLPASFSCFHPSYPSFLISRTSSLRNGHPLALVDAFFLILIAASIFKSSNRLKLLLLS